MNFLRLILSSNRWAGWLAGLAALALIMPAGSGANPTNGPLHLSLGDSLRMVGERHVSVLVANERVQQSLARLSQARSVMWPQITGGGVQTRQTRNLEAAGISLPSRPSLVGPFDSFDGRVKLTQALLDPSALLRLSAAKEGNRLSVVEARKTRQDAMLLVATIHLDAQRAEEALEVARAFLERDQERARLAKARLDLGIGSSLQWTQSEAELAGSQHRLQTAASESVERRLDLAAALGLPRDQKISFVAEAVVFKDLPSTEAEALMGLPEHPDLLAARQVVQQREAEHGVESAGFLPKLSAIADYGVSGRDPSVSDATYAMGIQVSAPIFEGGLRTARMKESASRVRESQARLNDVQEQVAVGVLSAREVLSKSIALVRAAEAGVAVAAKQFALARQRLKSGIGSALEMVESRAQFIQAGDHQREAIAAHQLARVNLAHALGDMESLISLTPCP